ncbi:MAG TPA: DPP IV N-terminal domain-containing protein [Planctomycetota bacterium]|nr:DPP IV N-terminal domain-containing protein [Planctomycetota bacterium]
MTTPRVVLLVAFAALLPPARAQQNESLTLATVLARGDQLVAAPPKVLWLPAGHAATIVQTAGDGGQTLHRWADGKLVEQPLTDAKTLLAALGVDAQAPARFPDLRWLDDSTLRIEHDRHVYRWRPGQAKAESVLAWAEPDAGETPLWAIAPGDARVAYVRGRQLWLAEADGHVRQITFDGDEDIVYGGAAHRAEFGIDRGLFWSPDGRFLGFSREDQRPIALYPYQDLSATPPRPVHGRYPMAGGPGSKVRLGVCDTTDFALRWLEHDDAEDVYWTNVTFARDGTLVVARVDRGQDHLELVRYDAHTGRRLATLLQEDDAEWIEPEHGPTFLADGRFLWWSSHDGHRHLFLHAADGARLGQVTKGTFDVQQLLGLSSDEKTVWFQASGEDPRQLHLFAASLDGSTVRQVTRERGVHRATLSPDGLFADVLWSNLETRPRGRLLDLQSGAVSALPQPPDPLANFALPTQRLFQIKASDDTVLYGHLAVPPDLADGQRCAVLLYVYGGPHVQLVQDQWLGGAPLWLQALAGEGYVVCRLDNRGTPNRGEQFEQAVYRRLGVLEVEDQLRAVEWLTRQPYVDATRIGVHGWSFGGYMTLRLMLAAPTTFACGVSGAPVTDWAMYETGYTERYMDTPAENPDGYRISSCLPYVEQLQRPLLLVQGTDDKTVMWSHSLAFVDRCIEAGKQIEYFPYPMQTHRLLGKDRVHFLNLLHDYLGRHLHPEVRTVEKAAAVGK